MKIIEQTPNKLTIEPKLSDLKTSLGMAIALVCAIFIVSVYLIGFVMPKDSTFSCDRVPNSPLYCQIEESFLIAPKHAITPIENVTQAKSEESIQIQTAQKIWGFIPFPDRQFTFPTQDNFDLILLSHRDRDTLVERINYFLRHRQENHLKIKLKSYTSLTIFCIIYFTVLLVILVILGIVFLTRERYSFNKHKKTAIWSSQILSLQPSEYEIEMRHLDLEFISQDEKQHYEINLHSQQPAIVHSLYRGRDREQAKQIAQLISNFLQKD